MTLLALWAGTPSPPHWGAFERFCIQASAAIVPGIILPLCAVVFLRALRAPKMLGPYYGTLARSLTVVFAVVLLFLAGIVWPAMALREAQLVKADPILRTVPGSHTVLEWQVKSLEEAKRRLRDALGNVEEEAPVSGSQASHSSAPIASKNASVMGNSVPSFTNST